ncbi:MAG: hypothetical protein Q4Q22_08325 [Methanosphaera sp.]|nr:hypothetical protein [Methanosphaera sp.]
MTLRTKINNNYQTAIPKIIRDEFDVDRSSYMEWIINEKNRQITVKFIKKPSLVEISNLSWSEK